MIQKIQCKECEFQTHFNRCRRRKEIISKFRSGKRRRCELFLPRYIAKSKDIPRGPEVEKKTVKTPKRISPFRKLLLFFIAICIRISRKLKGGQ